MSNQAQRLKLTQLAASIAFIAGGAVFVPSAHAAAPAAGINISNVASASYTDSTGNSKTVDSNIVTTTVLQVASFTLVSDQSPSASKNTKVSLSHTLTNTGNGSDTFAIAVQQNDTRDSNADDYDFSGLVVYLDANKDGVPDSQTPVTNVTLAAGQSVNLIVEGTTPSAIAAAALGKLTVSATSAWGNGGAGSATSGTGQAKVTTTDRGDAVRWNVDTVKITEGAVITLRKSASVTAVDATQASAAAREVEYTLTYQNTSNTTATNVNITDVLPAGLTYVNGTAKLSGSGLTDAVDGDGYKFDTTTKTVTLVLPSVAPNTTGTLTFKVTVDQNTPAGTITNIGYVDPDGPGTEPSKPSNPTDVTISSIKKGTINDRTDDAYADADATTALNKDNQIIIAEIKQGQQAVFGGTTGEKIVIHNTGNVSETFNVNINKAGLPANSIVTLYQADGVTPFIDTGLIASNGTYTVVAKITLPASYSTNTPIKAVLTSNPVSDATKTDTLDLVISKVTAATVDLHNGVAPDNQGTGTIAGASGKDTGTGVETKPTKPGQSVNFPLQIDNTGITGDNYNLSVDNLPSGWTVKFYTADGSGNPTGAPLTNTGNVTGGSNVKLVAVVTPPANEAAGDKEIIFRAYSPATQLSDVMSDIVTVQANRILNLQTDRIGQVAPGGTVLYKHTLTNTGNITEAAGSTGLPFTLTNDQSGNGWVTGLYVDLNNDGFADANELVTGNDLAALSGPIAKGASVNLLIKVQAPVNATVGTPSSVVLTINPTVVSGQTHASISNTDLTTVTNGQVRLVKEQALVDCATGTASSYTQNPVSAKPGQCVKYRITATNEGNANVTNVIISDATPAYTKLKVISGQSPVATNAALSSATAALADNSTGTVTAEKSPLAPSAISTLEFVIKVDN